jgi:hypothetical protein
MAMQRTCWIALLLPLGLLSCDRAPEPTSAEPFCHTLQELRAGRIEVESENPNEFVGHVNALEALIAVATGEVRTDLETIRDTFVTARDTGGWRTLFDFAGMQDPELAGAEGRISDWVATECGIRDAHLEWKVDTSVESTSLCEAWPRLGSPLMNNRFPYLIATAGANYFSAQFWSVPFLPAPPGFIDVPRGGRVEFKAEYPYARYFAYHPNDYETNNFPTLRDVGIDPDPGSVNPWREPQTGAAGRRYTAQLVFDETPAEQAPNTVYVGRTLSGKWNPTVFLLVRVYGADQGALPPNSAGVSLPEVTVYDAAGEVVAHHAACEPYPAGYEPPVDETAFPAFPVPDHRAIFRPGEVIFESNFGLPVTLLANADVVYLAGFHSLNWGEIYAVRARKPRTPSRRHGVPLHDPDVDLRLFTICDYNFWNGRAYGCVIDEDLPVDAEGNYTLVASSAAHRPEGSGFHWVDTGPFLDGQLTWRILLAGDPLAEELRSAVTGGGLSEHAKPYLPDVAQCSKAVFESGGFEACKTAWNDQLSRLTRH